jgi:hypothetical protein
VNTDSMELTNFHLGRRQKAALRARAKANGTNVAEELRTAVDAYLSGITPDELALLDAATRQAAEAIAEMADMLKATNRKADAVFAELERLHRGQSPALAIAESAGSVYSAKGRNKAKRKRSAP